MTNLFRSLIESAISAAEFNDGEAVAPVTDEIEDAINKAEDAFGESEGFGKPAPEGLAAEITSPHDFEYQSNMDNGGDTNENNLIDSDYYDNDELPEAAPHCCVGKSNIDNDEFTTVGESAYEDLF